MAGRALTVDVRKPVRDVFTEMVDDAWWRALRAEGEESVKLTQIDGIVRALAKPGDDYIVLMHPAQRRSWLDASVRERWKLQHRLARVRLRGHPDGFFKAVVSLECDIAALNHEIDALRGGVWIEEEPCST